MLAARRAMLRISSMATWGSTGALTFQLALMALVTGVLGCRADLEDVADGAAATPAPICVLGGGVLAFVPEHDGDTVPIIHGPQGGYHVWGSVLAHGVRFDRVEIV